MNCALMVAYCNNNEEEQGDNIDDQYGEDDLINEIYNMN